MAVVNNLTLIHRSGWTLFTTLKSTRLVSLSKERGYVHLNAIEWTPERSQRGIIVKLREVPFHVQSFKLVALNGDIGWVAINRLDETVTARRSLKQRVSVALAGRRTVPWSQAAYRLREMPMPKRSLAAQPPCPLLPCQGIAQSQGSTTGSNALSGACQLIDRVSGAELCQPRIPACLPA
jgi:hypothetical protein